MESLIIGENGPSFCIESNATHQYYALFWLKSSVKVLFYLKNWWLYPVPEQNFAKSDNCTRFLNRFSWNLMIVPGCFIRITRFLAIIPGCFIRITRFLAIVPGCFIRITRFLTIYPGCFVRITRFLFIYPGCFAENHQFLTIHPGWFAEKQQILLIYSGCFTENQRFLVSNKRIKCKTLSILSLNLSFFITFAIVYII